MKIQEPFIGISCDIHFPEGKRAGYYALYCDHRYIEAVRQAGGYPILLPIVSRFNIIRRYLDQIDGIVIVGGDDVNPHLYGERKMSGTGTVFAPRLRFECKLYREARKRELPIFGICYGMQLINVLEGGALFQDIRRDAKSPLEHKHKTNPYHRVKIDRASRLGRVIQDRTIVVHSDHHQAVSRVAPSFKPVAFAPDGIIEAIESESEKIFAVQWHPERSVNHPVTARLFKAFIRACGKS